MDWLLKNINILKLNLALNYFSNNAISGFNYNTLIFRRLCTHASYSSFSDPGFALTNEIKELTGINDEMIRGKNIDWNYIDELLAKCSIIISHNANFDRPFIDIHLTQSPNKQWAVHSSKLTGSNMDLDCQN